MSTAPNPTAITTATGPEPIVSRQSYRVRFPGGAGDELAGIIDRPRDQGTGQVLVFSHCFTCSKDLKSIVRIARAMAEEGIAVLRFDMTGLGDSHGDFSATSFSTNLVDLAAAIRFAVSELGPVTALMGHSFGGAASLATAGGAAGDAARASLRAVVTLAAPSDTGHLAELLARMDPAIERDGLGEVTIGGRAWPIRREMLDDFRKHDLPARIAEIDVPTLLFHSPDDETVSYEHATQLLRRLQSSPGGRQASLVTLSGADHLLVEDPRDLQFVAGTAANFLRRYASGP